MNKYLLILAVSVVFLACKKTKPKSSTKNITFFVLKQVSNTGSLTNNVIGRIVMDSIILDLPATVSVVNLTPTITHTGESITPNSEVAQNFTNPVFYTVKAADGSIHRYIVVVRRFSSTKEIVSFAFKAADNPGLINSDVNGTVEGDTIRLTVNALSLSNLVPAIIHTGVHISPTSGAYTNFINPVVYTVTAEDGSTRKYTVIVRSSISLFIAGHDGYLYAFDAAIGKVKWKYRLYGRALTSPTYANETVFIGSGYDLLALDAATGKLKWQTSLNAAASTSAQVVNNIIYIGVERTASGSFLIAVDGSNGEIRWKQNLPGDYVRCNPTVAEGRVVTAGFGYDLVCFDAATGTPLWNFDTGIIVDNPVIANGVVYIGSEFYKMIALDLRSGKKKWEIRSDVFENPRSHGLGSSPTVYYGTLYNGGESLTAYDTATGAVKWEYPRPNSSIRNPVGENGVVFTTHLDNVFAININGWLKWRIGNVGSTNWTVQPSSATVAHGVFFTGSGYDNKIIALDAATGVTKWSYEGSDHFTSGPCIVDGDGKIFHSAVSGAQQ